MNNTLLKYFGIRNENIFGIDIGGSSVKVMQVKKIQDKINIEHYAIEHMPPGIVVDKSIKKPKLLQEFIMKVINKAGCKENTICIALPNSEIVTKKLSLEADVKESNMLEEVELELVGQLPYDVDDAYIDYSISPAEKHDSATDNTNLDVTAFVVKKDILNARLDLFTELNLQVRVVDLESLCLERASNFIIKKLPKIDNVVGVVDIGANVTSFSVYRDGIGIYNREQNFGGQYLTDEIQGRYGLTFEEAMEANKLGQLPADYVEEILEPFKEKIMYQVSRACQVFLSTGKENIIHHLILTGGISVMPGLDLLIANKLNIKTTALHPFLEVTFSENIDKEQFLRDATRFTHCFGMALRNVYKDDVL